MTVSSDSVPEDATILPDTDNPLEVIETTVLAFE
jgi:hypothetical protein